MLVDEGKLEFRKVYALRTYFRELFPSATERCVVDQSFGAILDMMKGVPLDSYLKAAVAAIVHSEYAAPPREPQATLAKALVEADTSPNLCRCRK